MEFPHCLSKFVKHTPILLWYGVAELFVHKLLAILCDSDVHFILIQSGFWWSNVACTYWTCFYGGFHMTTNASRYCMTHNADCTLAETGWHMLDDCLSHQSCYLLTPVWSTALLLIFCENWSVCLKVERGHATWWSHKLTFFPLGRKVG
jgi:hypothetical protein